jgi:hypothetical protein
MARSGKNISAPQERESILQPGGVLARHPAIFLGCFPKLPLNKFEKNLKRWNTEWIK